MTEQLTIEQMNQAICAFMGGYKSNGYVWFYVGPDGFEHESGSFLKYHSDWNWLMPVWYKFVDLRFTDPMQQFKHSELKTTIGYAILYGSIKIAHGNIFEGIQWLNKQQL
jgi:hypothetical protein